MPVQGTSRQGYQAKVELSGPFFTKDPGKTVRANIVDFLDRLAEYGEGRIRKAIAGKAGKMPNYTGWTHDHVVGRTRAELARGGKRWVSVAVVSANTDGMTRKDAIRTKAAGASIEARWRPFKSAAFAMGAKARTVDLTKGLE